MATMTPPLDIMGGFAWPMEALSLTIGGLGCLPDQAFNPMVLVSSTVKGGSMGGLLPSTLGMFPPSYSSTMVSRQLLRVFCMLRHWLHLHWATLFLPLSSLQHTDVPPPSASDMTMSFSSFAGSNKGFGQPLVPGAVPGPLVHGGIPGFVPPFHGRFPPAPPTPPVFPQGLPFVPLAPTMVPMAPTVLPGLVPAVVPPVVPAVPPLAPVVVPAAAPVITPAVAPPITSVGVRVELLKLDPLKDAKAFVDFLISYTDMFNLKH
jgi:hypothetical protein